MAENSTTESNTTLASQEAQGAKITHVYVVSEDIDTIRVERMEIDDYKQVWENPEEGHPPELLDVFTDPSAAYRAALEHATIRMEEGGGLYGIELIDVDAEDARGTPSLYRDFCTSYPPAWREVRTKS